MTGKTIVTIKRPDGGVAAQVWCWSDIEAVDWCVFFRPLAELITDAVWECEPIPDDVTDKTAFTGH
jgi:hypothetical protein